MGHMATDSSTQGVEVVAANADDESSLVQAFEVRQLYNKSPAQPIYSE